MLAGLVALILVLLVAQATSVRPGNGSKEVAAPATSPAPSAKVNNSTEESVHIRNAGPVKQSVQVKAK